ncbi:MAG: chemotaxis protein [bacterium]
MHIEGQNSSHSPSNTHTTNRLELLLFEVGDGEMYGINVFKVREAILCPPVTVMPGVDSNVKGVTTLREQTISVIDLAGIMGTGSLEVDSNYLIVAEFSRLTQGLLVKRVDRIVTISWDSLEDPPLVGNSTGYISSIVRVDDNTLVQVVDVEKVLEKMLGSQIVEICPELLLESQKLHDGVRVLVVDDSSVARNQILRTLEQLGVKATLSTNGKEALDTLLSWAKMGNIHDKVDMVISDIEMPVMDGYSLASAIRNEKSIDDLWVLLHSSLSGSFNHDLVTQAGADDFLAKFDTDDLARKVLSHLVTEQKHVVNQ